MRLEGLLLNFLNAGCCSAPRRVPQAQPGSYLSPEESRVTRGSKQQDFMEKVSHSNIHLSFIHKGWKCSFVLNSTDLNSEYNIKLTVASHELITWSLRSCCLHPFVSCTVGSEHVSQHQYKRLAENTHPFCSFTLLISSNNIQAHSRRLLQVYFHIFNTISLIGTSWDPFYNIICCSSVSSAKH